MMECVASGGFTGKIMEGCALRTQTSEKHSSVFTDEKHGKHPPTLRLPEQVLHHDAFLQCIIRLQ